jgi:hypothetical protein
MARFDIYRNIGRSKTAAPFLIDVQNSSVSGLRTRIVIPLRTTRPFSSLARIARPDLCPVLNVEGVDYFLATAELGAIEFNKLGALVTSGIAYQNAIQAALDRIFGSH